MLLRHSFDQPEVNLALELFLREIHGFFGDRLISVVLYGSITFDDLAPGYGDLDFLAVIRDEVSDDDCARLREMRSPLRSGDYGVMSQMIEGAFLPRKMLNPEVEGRAFWWGTGSERDWEKNVLGWVVLHVIRERGITVWGEDVRHEIPPVDRKSLIAEFSRGLLGGKPNAKGGGLHSVDWLLSIARTLLWLREGRLSSKSEAAEWGQRNVRGSWRELLPRAKYLRLNPTVANCADVKKWLETLDGPIQEAFEELEREFSITRND
jgi:hypothetical protein